MKRTTTVLLFALLITLSGTLKAASPAATLGPASLVTAPCIPVFINELRGGVDFALVYNPKTQPLVTVTIYNEEGQQLNFIELRDSQPHRSVKLGMAEFPAGSYTIVVDMPYERFSFPVNKRAEESE